MNNEASDANFKMIPETEQIEQLQRDLRFHPATVTDPKILSGDQIEHFNREGYVRPIPVFDADEMVDIRIYFDDLLQQTIAAGGDSYSISTAHMKHGKVYDLLTEPRILDCVADLLGEDIIAWGSHFFCKMPHDGKAVAWHQDASYWPLTPSKAVTVWLAIDDADAENACMRFIAGSQHFGHMTYRSSEGQEHNVLNQTIDNPQQYGTEVDDELKAGQMSLHSDLLLHGSEANESDRRRCGLTLRYCAADVTAELGWNAKGVVVRGKDANGHWGNPPRPAND